MRTVRDPVCGMQVSENQRTITRVYRGRTFGFCCTGCSDAFDGDPERFAGGDPDSPAAPWLLEREH